MPETPTLKIFKDSRGILLPIEFSSLPFKPKRIFFIKDVPPQTERGNHAHFRTEQYLVCLSGRIEVTLFDGYKENTFEISENMGVHVPKMIWDSQKFLAEGSSLAVFASTKYDQKDYINNKDEFIEIVMKQKESK